MLSNVPPVLRWSIFAADRSTAVGPRRSDPCTGEIPSDRGLPAFLPSGVAPVTDPKYTWQVVGSICTRQAPPFTDGRPSTILKTASNTYAIRSSARSSSFPQRGIRFTSH